MVSSAEIRMQKDLNELILPPNITLNFPDPNCIMHFFCTITPDQGLYRNGNFHFEFQYKSTYPHDPPKVKCTQTIFHPNIDEKGNICLNLLREDWNPVLSLSAVLYGLQFILLEPNFKDFLVKNVAEIYETDKNRFCGILQLTLNGGTFDGIQYSNVYIKN